MRRRLAKKLPRKATLAADQRLHLLNGVDLGAFNDVHCAFDAALLHTAWNDNRKELLDEWIKEHPGTRPWAWWEFDSPAATDGELRRHTGGSAPIAGSPLHMGHESYYRDKTTTFESEFDYLSRHRLLRAVEKK